MSRTLKLCIGGSTRRVNLFWSWWLTFKIDFEKKIQSLDGLVDAVQNQLDSIGDEMMSNSLAHFNSHLQKLPNFTIDGNKLQFSEPIQTNKVYEFAFAGNDAEAEMIEKSTGLSFLGDSTKLYDKEQPCVITGTPTTRKIYLAKTY